MFTKLFYTHFNINSWKGFKMKLFRSYRLLGKLSVGPHEASRFLLAVGFCLETFYFETPPQNFTSTLSSINRIILTPNGPRHGLIYFWGLSILENWSEKKDNIKRPRTLVQIISYNLPHQSGDSLLGFEDHQKWAYQERFSTFITIIQEVCSNQYFIWNSYSRAHQNLREFRSLAITNQGGRCKTSQNKI